jgi:outer membrane protein OmpA-like peptidoglycan-associated protein
MTSHPETCRPLLRLGAVCACSLIALSGGGAHAWPTWQSMDAPGALIRVQAQPAEEPELQAFDELNKALTTARSRLDQQLERIAEAQRAAAEQLAAMDRKIEERDQQLEDMAERNAASAAAAERADADAARVRKQLGAVEERLETVIKARATAEAKIGDMETVVESALGEAADLSRQLSELKDTEAEARETIDQLKNQRDQVRSQLASERTARQEVERDLAQVQSGLEQKTQENEELNRELAALRSAADEARVAAEQNLEAVEEKIRLLDQALAQMRPEQDDRTPSAQDDDQSSTDTEPRDPAEGSPSSGAAPQSDGPPATSTALNGSEPAPGREANASERTELAALESDAPDDAEADASATAAAPAGSGPAIPLTLAEAASQLSMEKRLQAQSLLADLRAEKSSDGVVMRVPGEELFALDSEVIEPAAHETLAKVAELIGMFDDRDIRIIGHTDAMGDAEYNQALSERRAGLVKKFFVDNYDLAEARLEVVGAGERQPIATNATRSGRRANRRVEVVIED